MKHNLFAVDSYVCVMVRSNMTEQIRTEKQRKCHIQPASSEGIR